MRLVKGAVTMTAVWLLGTDELLLLVVSGWLFLTNFTCPERFAHVFFSNNDVDLLDETAKRHLMAARVLLDAQHRLDQPFKLFISSSLTIPSSFP